MCTSTIARSAKLNSKKQKLTANSSAILSNHVLAQIWLASTILVYKSHRVRFARFVDEVCLGLMSEPPASLVFFNITLNIKLPGLST